ncbi:MAG: serine/threonine-protein kinase [Planctomycetota bacterium]|nr:serine/threonine-protein kinase [Planctomycetota bacterium]MDI6787801.1 serine/threonine-protein kinase [Planctomycetota bacterium]
MTNNTTDSLIGHTFGGCRLIKKIGEGGMGIVYLAHHLALNKNVAIKVLPPSFAQEEERVKRFIREARSAAQLEHSNIVQIYNIAKHEDFYFIVMQYIDGESFATKIKNNGKINLLEAIRIIRDVSSALGVAHKKGIIHRDIKPENIMVNQSGEVKLMDFGLARSLDVASSLSRTGEILGTPFYLSPEQAQGLKVDARADIYALGVTLYHMLSGKRPFEGDTTVSIILKHINEKPPPLRQITPEIPETVSSIVHKMLEKDPDKRYQSTDELIDDITSAYNKISAEDSNARTITALTVPQKPVKKLINWKIVVGAGIVAMIIMIGISNIKKKKQPPPPPQKEQVAQPLKNNLIRRCEQTYKHLVDKEYEKIKPYIYTKHIQLKEGMIISLLKILKRKHEFHELRGNKITDIKIGDINYHKPSKEIPLPYAEVQTHLSLYNTKSPPTLKDAYLIIPQTHIWVLDEGEWYLYIPLKKEDKDKEESIRDSDNK